MENVKFTYFLNMNCTFNLDKVDLCVFEKCNCYKFKANLLMSCSFIDFLNEDCIFNVEIDPSKPLYSDKNITNLVGSIIVTNDVPIPKIEETLCPILNIWNNVSNVKPNKSLNYIYLPPILEIVECKFIDISVIADSGSAINFDHPMYEFLSYDPKIIIDRCLFLNCVSDSCPGALRINYTRAQVSINKMCSLNCGGNYYTVLHILTYSPIHFNSSTIYSTNGISSQFDGSAMGFYDSLASSSYSNTYITGMNHTAGRFTLAPSSAMNASVKLSIFDNLTSTAMLGWIHSISIKCNFIELKCSRWSTSFLASIDDYIFDECVFYRTEILDIAEIYNYTIDGKFINCYLKKYNDSFDGIYNDVSVFLNVKCTFPKKGIDRMVLFYSLLAASIVFVTIVSVGTYFIFRKHQKVIEDRYQLERNLMNDYG